MILEPLMIILDLWFASSPHYVHKFSHVCIDKETLDAVLQSVH